jgi:hypothetical protein
MSSGIKLAGAYQSGGKIENVPPLQVMNATETTPAVPQRQRIARPGAGAEGTFTVDATQARRRRTPVAVMKPQVLARTRSLLKPNQSTPPGRGRKSVFHPAIQQWKHQNNEVYVLVKFTCMDGFYWRRGGFTPHSLTPCNRPTRSDPVVQVTASSVSAECRGNRKCSSTNMAPQSMQVKKSMPPGPHLPSVDR